MAENKFYVYVYLDPRKVGSYKYGEYEFEAEPFYVGKGHGSRCTHWKQKNIYNTRLENKIKKIVKEYGNPIVLKVVEDMLEADAFILEIKLINIIGRADKKLGLLLNLTDGGDGFCGYKFPEKIKKQREASFKKTMSAEGYVDPRKGRKLSKEHVAKVVASNLKTIHADGYVSPLAGKKQSKEHIEKYTASHLKTIHAPGYINPNTGKKRPDGANEKMIASRKITASVNGYVHPLNGRKRPDDVIAKCVDAYKKIRSTPGYIHHNAGIKQTKEHVEKRMITRKKNKDNKIKELYQSIINLIIRKEEILCGV